MRKIGKNLKGIERGQTERCLSSKSYILILCFTESEIEILIKAFTS